MDRRPSNSFENRSCLCLLIVRLARHLTAFLITKASPSEEKTWPLLTTTKKLKKSKAQEPLCFLRDRHKSEQSHSLRFRVIACTSYSKFVELLRGQVRCVNFTIFFKSLPLLTTKKLRSSKARDPLCFLRDRHKSDKSDK